MDILKPLTERGYPADYVFARVRVRHGYLLTDWDALLAAPDPLAAVPPAPNRRPSAAGTRDGAWESVLAEFSWLYGQMEEKLRRVFVPVFTFFELRTILLALRYRSGGDAPRAALLLDGSLLDDTLRRTLSADKEPAEIVGNVAARLAETPFERRRLVAAYRNRGSAGFEEGLTNSLLPRLAAGRHPAPVDEFLRFLIDLGNILAIEKELRWRVGTPPRLMDGGTLPPSLLREALGRGDREGIEALVARLGGEGIPGTPAEERLLAALGRRLRRRGYEPSGIGLVLHYLWRLVMEGRNLRLLARWRELDRETIRRGLVP